MENREAIEWLKGCVVSYEVDNKGKPNGNVTCELIQEVIDMAISALEKQEADRWIPVTERLPEEKDAGILKKLGTNKRSDYVLATVEVKGEKMTVMACTYDGKWYWDMKHAFPDYKIIAWRPRPEPYEAEEET